MKKKYKILIFLGGLIILILGSGITYSLFHASTNMTSNNQNIAKFIFNAESLDVIELPLIDLQPGDIKEYSFAVSNNSLGNLTEVSTEYQLTIKTFHLVPLNIQLYKINGETEELILTCDETYTRNEDNELICNAPVLEMGYSIEEINNFKLKIEFPSQYNDEIYANLVDYINIEIKSWQKTQ